MKQKFISSVVNELKASNFFFLQIPLIELTKKDVDTAFAVAELLQELINQHFFTSSSEKCTAAILFIAKHVNVHID
jgi:hypothetical protein